MKPERPDSEPSSSSGIGARDEALAGSAGETFSAGAAVLDPDATPQNENTTIALTAEEIGALNAERIGPYRLIRVVGRGGMGTVYLAVRADDEFQKRVAIKLVSRGMNSEIIVRRFRRERQILASLDHPNIARLLDGGTTDEGIPYFVMEYVDGKRLYEYADSHKLSTADRLRLFRTICSAVHFAHQNLVVHRDLKPGNVLVTATGVPKLLDFGIAKLLNPELSADSIDPTATELRLMTPEYASPEQVRGEPITTASDVYSLGVVLYELLSGYRPYVIKDRSPLAILRVVCEHEPQKPSTAVTQVIGDAKSTGKLASHAITPDSISKARESEPDKLRRRLSGDLDNIVMKALAKEPQRRYASVEQFSEDIQRHLDGMPVVARPDTFGYRVSKFVSRNKVAAIGGALLFLSLIAGISGTAWQAHKAQQQRERAERRFNDVRSLANAVMFDLDAKIQDLPGSTDARRFLVTKSLEYLDRLAQEASGDLSLQRELATAYEKVGDVQGGEAFGSVGDSSGALQSYQKAHAIREAIVASDPSSRDYRLELARSHDNLGKIVGDRGNQAEALDHFRKSQAIREPLASASPSDRRAQSALATSYFLIGTALVDAGDFAGAREALRKQMIIFESLATGDNATPGDRRNLSLSYKYYGGMLERDGDSEQALSLYQKAVAIDEARAAQDSKNTQVRLDLSFSLGSVAHVLLMKKDYNASLETYRKALALREAVVAADAANVSARGYVAKAHASIAVVQEESGDSAGAIESYRKSISIREAMAAGDPGNADLRMTLADSYADLGLLQGRLGADPKSALAARAERWRTARSLFQRSLEILNDLSSKGKLAGPYVAKRDNLSQEIAKAEDALAKLQGR